jgi:hypothetical protein
MNQRTKNAEAMAKMPPEEIQAAAHEFMEKQIAECEKNGFPIDAMLLAMMNLSFERGCEQHGPKHFGSWLVQMGTEIRNSAGPDTVH